MNSNEKIKFIKEILSGGGVIFLITLLSYYFIAIKYEIVFSASDLPTDFIDLPFYKLAKDLGDLFLIVILFVFCFMFLQICFTRLILTTSLIENDRYKDLIRVPFEFTLDPIKSQKKAQINLTINDTTTPEIYKEALKKELSRRAYLRNSSIFYLIFGLVFIIIFFVDKEFSFFIILSKILNSLGYISNYFLVNGIIMSLYGLYVMFAVLNRKHSYLFVIEDFFRKFTFLITMTMIIGSLSILIVILMQYEGKTELTILQSDKNTLSIIPSSPKVGDEYSFDYLILETNTAAIWRRAKIKIPPDDSSIKIEPTDVYIRTSNDEDRIYNLEADSDWDISGEKMKINFLFKDLKSLQKNVDEIQKVLIH